MEQNTKFQLLIQNQPKSNKKLHKMMFTIFALGLQAILLIAFWIMC